MTDPTFIPEPDRQLVAVYGSPAVAENVREALRGAGVPDGDVSVDQPDDEIASLRGEMHEELTQAWVVPNAAFATTKEGMKGITFVGVVASVIGLLGGVALASVDFGSTYGVRLVVFGVIGLGFGATIGLVAGAGMGARRPAELAAAHRGVVLRVRANSPALRELLARFDPIRLDEITGDGDPIDTVTTEGDGSGGTDRIGRVLRDSVRGDDYSPRDKSRTRLRSAARSTPQRGAPRRP